MSPAMSEGSLNTPLPIIELSTRVKRLQRPMARTSRAGRAEDILTGCHKAPRGRRGFLDHDPHEPGCLTVLGKDVGSRRNCEEMIPEGSPRVAGGGALFATPPVMFP